MRAQLTVVAILLAASPSNADEGETAFFARAGAEASTLRHPAAREMRTATEARLIPLGLVAIGTEHGVTNAFSVSTALEVAAATGAETTNVRVRGTDGAIVSGLVLDVRLPVAAHMNIDWGAPMAAALGAELVPTFSVWSMAALVDPTRRDAEGRPLRLPVNVPDEVSFGGIARVRASLSIRAFDVLAITISPFLAGGWCAGPTFAGGASLSVAWLASVGPL